MQFPYLLRCFVAPSSVLGAQRTKFMVFIEVGASSGRHDIVMEGLGLTSQFVEEISWRTRLSDRDDCLGSLGVVCQGVCYRRIVELDLVVVWPQL